MKKVFIFVLLSIMVLGCSRGQDALAMEMQEFPSVFEVISGKTLIHSKAFYNWRINDRLKQIEIEPDNYTLYDELAMAYDQIGEFEKARSVLFSVYGLAPNRFKTLINLGTLYINSGYYDMGAAFIEQVITENPDAHFGLEIFQLQLAKYMMFRHEGYERGGAVISLYSFAQYLSYEQSQNSILSEKLALGKGMQKAIDGIVVMLHSGNNNSPVLLEALGDLLLYDDANRLAARAFLKASRYSHEESETERLYAKAVDSVSSQEFNELIFAGDSAKIKYVHELFLDEINSGFLFQALISRLEARWIKDGKNVEEEFDKRFYTD